MLCAVPRLQRHCWENLLPGRQQSQRIETCPTAKGMVTKTARSGTSLLVVVPSLLLARPLVAAVATLMGKLSAALGAPRPPSCGTKALVNHLVCNLGATSAFRFTLVMHLQQHRSSTSLVDTRRWRVVKHETPKRQ